jgi:hypothetical protein
MASLRDVFNSPDLQGIFGLEVVRQTLPNAGGCAALATVLRHFGMYASEHMLAESLVPNTAVGVGPEQLIEVCCKKGLLAAGFKGYPALHIIDRARAGQFTLLKRQDRADHWVIPAGIEPIMEQMILADPGREGSSFSCMRVADFIELWDKQTDVVIAIDRPCRYGALNGAKRRGTFTVQTWRDPKVDQVRYAEKRANKRREKRAAAKRGDT